MRSWFFACNRYGHWKKALIALLLLVGLSALLFKPLEQALHRLYVKNRVVRLIVKLAHTRPDLISGKAKLESLNVTYRGERLLVSIEGFLPKEQLVDEAGTLEIEKRVNLVAEYLSEDLGEPAVVEFDFIPVEMLRVSSGRSRTTNAEEEADKDNDQP